MKQSARRARDTDDDDADDTSSRKKGSTSRKSRAGVSLDEDDAIDVGLFSSGPAVVKESIFAEYDYGGNAKPTPVWLITFTRDGEEYEQPYSLGKGWKVSADGKTLIARAGQTGLPKSCNAMRHLVKPLKLALKDADIEIDLASGDPSVLDGLEVVLRRVDQEKRDIGGKKKDDKERTILEIEEVTGTDGDTESKPTKGKKDKKKPTRKSDNDEDADDDQDEDSDSDDDEDEKPSRGAKAKAGDKKKKPAADSDDDDDADADSDDDEDESVKEEAIEVLIDLVSVGDVKYADLDRKITKATKGHKKAKAIIAWAMDKRNLKLEQGWMFDGKMIRAENSDDD